MFGKVKSLRELFEIELQYAYDCEQKLVAKGLPPMIENTGSQELRTALQQHLRETQNHLARLEQVFTAVGIAPDTKSNEVFDKLASAVKDSITNIDDSPLRDAALIAIGNQLEHYEIALYGTLAAFARHLGLQAAVGPLQETLQEEKAADAAADATWRIGDECAGGAVHDGVSGDAKSNSSGPRGHCEHRGYVGAKAPTLSAR